MDFRIAPIFGACYTASNIGTFTPHNEAIMSKQILELKNSVYWSRKNGDKVYIEAVQIAFDQCPFANRQVIVQFEDGPMVDLSIYDMDRLVAAYLSLRGLVPPTELNESKAPDQCDFTVPRRRL